MINLVETIADLDQAPELHAARLLILLDTFAGSEGRDRMEGLTKLAKLDFLLRYPVMLERALAAKRRSTARVRLEEHESRSVESEMVRYRFGPWDHRYRSILNILVAKKLATVAINGRTVVIGITPLGRQRSNELSENDLFEPYRRRSAVLKSHFDLKGTNLMRFIYDTFPEVVSLRSGASITL